MDIQNYFKRLDEFFSNNDIAGAQKFSESNLSEAQMKQDFPAILAISNELGGLYRVKGEFLLALSAYESALNCIMVLNLENKNEHAMTMLNLGSVHLAMNNMVDALDSYEKAKLIFEKIGENHPYKLAALYNNLSHVHAALGNYQTAMEYATNSQKLIEIQPDTYVEKGTTYTSIGSIYTKLGRTDKALSVLLKAEKIFLENAKGNPHLAACQNALAELFFEKGDFIKAVDYFEKALAIVEKTYGKGDSYAKICRNLGTAWDKIGKVEFARNYFSRAEAIEQEMRK